jgi:hypothetical protein
MTQEQKHSGIEEVEIVEVEEYGKKNEAPPPAKTYRVRIDNEKYDFNQRFVTGRELLEKAGKTPYNQWRILQKLHGGKMEEVGYDQRVDLGSPGLERFTTIALNVGDGEGYEADI